MIVWLQKWQTTQGEEVTGLSDGHQKMEWNSLLFFDACFTYANGRLSNKLSFPHLFGDMFQLSLKRDLLSIQWRKALKNAIYLLEDMKSSYRLIIWYSWNRHRMSSWFKLAKLYHELAYHHIPMLLNLNNLYYIYYLDPNCMRVIL